MNMFEHDRSAARGKMATRKLIVFEHSTPLGNCQAHTLFDAVKVRKKSEGPARSFSDYDVTIDAPGVPSSVKTDREAMSSNLYSDDELLSLSGIQHFFFLQTTVGAHSCRAELAGESTNGRRAGRARELSMTQISPRSATE